MLFGVLSACGQGLATLPEFLWEASLGIYLTVKGFRPAAMDALMRAPGSGPVGVREERSGSDAERVLPLRPALTS